MKYVKKYWWMILVLGVAIYILILNIKINRLSDEKQIQAVELSTLNDSIFILKNKEGELTFKLNSVNIEKNNLKKSLELLGVDYKDLKDDNIKWRRLNNVLQLKLSAIGSIETHITDTFRVEKTDTLYYSRVNDWTNGFLSIFNAKIEHMDLFSNYRYDVGVNFFQEPTRKGTIVSVQLTDPNASIISANSITVVSKKTIWDKWWLWTAAGAAGGILLVK